MQANLGTHGMSSHVWLPISVQFPGAPDPGENFQQPESASPPPGVPPSVALPHAMGSPSKELKD